jgi:hypothetical protein
MRRHLVALSAASLAAVLNGSCAVRTQSSGERPSKLSDMDVQSLVMKMADDYSIGLTEAMRPIIMDQASDSTVRRSAVWIQRNGMASAIDIAVEANPDAALLDMLVLVSLQRWSFGEHWAATGIPEPHARRAAEGLQRAEAAAWKSASAVLTDAQQQALRSLIDEWIRENPDSMTVAFVRFDEFINIRHEQPLANRAKGLLREVSEASMAVDSARLLGERTLWYAARCPLVLGLQMESTYYQIADLPDFRSAIEAADAVKRFSGSIAARADSLDRDLNGQQALLFERLAAERTAAIDQVKVAMGEAVRAAAEDLSSRAATARDEALTQTFDRLAKERKDFLDDVESRDRVLRDTMTDFRATVGASSALAKELTGTVNALDRVVGRFDPQSRGDQAGLDMKDVRDAAIEAAKAAEKLTILLERTNELAASDLWDQRLSRLDRATAGVIDRAFWRGVWLVLALLTGLALIRLLPHRTRPSTSSRAS